MMTLPTDETTSPLSSQRDATALVATDEAVGTMHGVARQSDLELRLLQTFVTYTTQHVVQSYCRVKHASRVTRLLADTTESLVSRSGLVALVRLLFHQYMRRGHPVVQHVDEALGKRVIDAVVRLLMLAEQSPDDHQPTALLALQADPYSSHDTRGHDELLAATKLSYAERVQALLLGQVPRMEQALVQARLDMVDTAARQDPVPLVMELKDFVPVDEVARLKEESKEQLHHVMLETTRLRTQMAELTQEKQRLEQKLTDVHNYRESERGRRFEDMEKDLARTKLEATQKAYDLRKLQLVVDELQRKHTHKTKKKKKNTNTNRTDDNQSNTSESAPPSSVPEKRSDTGHEGKRSRQRSNVTA